MRPDQQLPGFLRTDVLTNVVKKWLTTLRFCFAPIGKKVCEA